MGFTYENTNQLTLELEMYLILRTDIEELRFRVETSGDYYFTGRNELGQKRRVVHHKVSGRTIVDGGTV